jgi:DNA-directed RNA polymerase specialized sigma24 family protein
VIPDGSVTIHIGKLKAGDDAAARLLWQRYFQRLVRLARRKLQGQDRAAADEEDVALTAFANFCRHAGQGRLPNLRDRDDLWRMLVTLTVRTAIDQVRHEGCQKRGGPGADNRAAAGATIMPIASADQISGRQPTPQFIVQVAEECERLLGGLGDAELQTIAVWKTEGYTNEEIADKLGVVLRTVERKVRTIRERWSEADDSSG